MSYVYIDAGLSHIKIMDKNGSYVEILNNENADDLIEQNKLHELVNDSEVFLGGKLATVFQKHLEKGAVIDSAASLWARASANKISNTAIIDISASGFMLICVDENGKLIDELLITNPKCGAGTGINLNRILQKLDLKVNEVDDLLQSYLGEEGAIKRVEIPIRADRCGVFSSSATISDKNQGIPLEHALAVTIKSEVLKACKKLTAKAESVILTGGVFLWQFAQDCAKDYLIEQGVKEIKYEKYCIIAGMQYIAEELKTEFKQPQIKKLRKADKFVEYPNFSDLKNKYQAKQLYKRIEQEKIANNVDLSLIPINIAFDIGSTEVKVAIEDAVSHELVYIDSLGNSGDTVTTIKAVFINCNVSHLNIQQIGITGSGRYQVKTILEKVYPSLQGSIFALVENYAHARGSIDLAKNYLKELPSEVNKEFCVLVDIGGEDTKLSTISLAKEELFDNVMNVKCSAGTGSLMDTLKSMFGIESISEASRMAFESKTAYEINATCAVFLMENAKKMQIEGFNKDEILASCNFAIVENMARTLWNQVELPKNALVLLHGQTMLSDPLPLAVTHRIQESGNMYCLVPPNPGHRACIGLLKTMKSKEIVDNYCDLNVYINQTFAKKIVICHGIACGDKEAKCSRTLLRSNEDNTKLLLGGCTAVNELMAKQKKSNLPNIDAYKDIWNFINDRMPQSESPNRLVLPRMFAVSEYAFFLAKILEHMNIPVHVDVVKENDVISAQADFSVDVCAPFIGVKGQLRRLAQENHGVILLPQIDFLPTQNTSLGRTCTVNQGGISIARNLVQTDFPNANFIEFDLSLTSMDGQKLESQLINKLVPIAEFYKIDFNKEILKDAISKALIDEEDNRVLVANKAAEYISKAIEYKRNISIVCAREYVLNPGIYDSHIGRLLRDKHVIAIPSYVLRTKLDIEFDHIYWKNPHDILSKIKAVSKKELHKIMMDDKPRELIKKIESNLTDSQISTTQVSTFRCGPDSVTIPTATEYTANKPSLLIQSDGMIKELAHLENRVNTHINQLDNRLHEINNAEEIDFKIINDFGVSSINFETDVVYIPTLHDNRAITSVLKASGATIIDNYSEDTYDLEKISKLGRKYAGDSICVPLASVFGDFILAREDFLKRKINNDALVEGKTRVLLFNNKGTGPCRQGQYFEQHKLLAAKHFSSDFSKFVVGHESANFNIGLEEWTLIQVYHSVLIKSVLDSLFLKAGSAVNNIEEFELFKKEFNELKEEIYHILKTKTKPKEFFLKLLKQSKGDLVTSIVKYFVYGLNNNNGIPKILRKFSNKWVKEFDPKVSVHIEGEVFVRSAQVIEIFKSIIDTVGFRVAQINYSPIWSYLELAIEEEITILNDEIDILNQELINEYKKIKQKSSDVKKKQLIIKVLRNKIAKPLYEAAKVEIPDDVREVLDEASKLFPTLKPIGELMPFTGEALTKLDKKKVDILFNVYPEGCMVASMGQVISQKILQQTKRGRIEYLSTLNGELDDNKIFISLLKCLGPVDFYRSQEINTCVT